MTTTTAQQASRRVKAICERCGKTARQHCAECQVCHPRDNEHPYWCENASRYGQ